MDTKKLRQKILDLAIHGKLVPQDPNDEPASVLLERIRAEKERLIAEGKIKRSKKSATSDTSHYENVPFEVPEGWCWVKIRDLCYYLGGYAFKSTQYVASSDNQVIRIGNVKDDKILFESQPVFITDDYAVTAESALLKNNDLLFTMTGTKGKRDYFKTSLVRVGKKRLFLNQRVGCLRSYSTHVYMEYLCLAMKHTCVLDAIFQTETGNVSQGNIGSENTLDLLIPLPSLNEQKRIVQRFQDCISDIDSVELNTIELKKVIERLKSKILDLAIHGKLVPQDPNDEPASELLKRINPKFVPCDNPHYANIPSSWVCTTMGSIFQHNTGKALNKSASTEGALLPYLTTSNVYWKTFDLSVVKEMRFKESEIEKCTIRKGDLLVCEGGDIGRAAIWDKDYSICIQNHLHRLRPKGDVVPLLYLYYIMYLKLTNNLEGKGIGLQGFSSGLLDKLEVPLPPYNEQIRIVDKIQEAFNMLDSIAELLN